MSIICFYITGDEDAPQTLHYGMDLATKTDRDLQVICALPDLTATFEHMEMGAGYGVASAVPSHLINEQNNTADQTQTDFENALAASSVSSQRAKLEIRYGFLPHIAADAALLADMLVFPARAGRPGHAYSAAFLHVLTKAATPVVLAGKKPSAPGPAIVAWDGSEQAMRAIRAHLPLLEMATEVIILHNPNKLKHILRSPRRAPTALQNWLEVRNLKSRLVSITGNVGSELLDTAAMLKANTIIAGAYGHSRLGEYLFGGVTRTLLQADAPQAIALCH